MNRFGIALVLLVLGLTPAQAQAPAAPASGKITLPANIKWETNDTDPIIGSPKALRGGTLRLELGSYPLTFRLMGPNTNDSFAGWNRAFSMNFTLVQIHPITGRYIPMMATAWSVQPDNKTIYFKLDPDARWSDGQKITADDYLQTYKMMDSPYVIDPYYTMYTKQFFQSVDKIDDYTIRIVGRRPSWRPIYDYAYFPPLWPTPAHATVVDKDWIKRTNNQWQIVPGPYVVTKTVRGDSVTFTRLKDWWGDKKRYFQGLYNFDEIYLKAVPDGRALDYLRLGQIDMMGEPSASAWREQYNFPAVNNGWIRRARIFYNSPVGVGGLHMNLNAPIFQDKNFRIAMQYLFNFEYLNKTVMFSDYYRINSFFEGTEFANPAVKAYPFDPIKAKEYLAKAGFHRPQDLQAKGFWARLSSIFRGLLSPRSDTDSVLVNDKGEKASFTLIYGSKLRERFLTIMQQDYRRAGVDIKLQLLEPGTAFERALERKYEMTAVAWSGQQYPDPRQALGSEFKNILNNNDIWGFGSPIVDRDVNIYEHSMDADARRNALYRIDQVVHDQAFYLPFYDAPYIRLAYWDYIQFPDFYLPKNPGLGGDPLTDFMVYWFDPQKKAALDQAMKTGKSFRLDPDMDKDFYGIRKKLQ